MKTKDTCICSSELRRKTFSENFDSLHCNNCGSSRFAAKLNGSGCPAPEYEYGGDNEKYAEKSYLHGKQLRWAHKELLKQDWVGRKVLEIGCFNGFFLDELKKRGAEVYGFDVNHEAVTVGIELFALENRLDVSLERLSTYGPFDDILCIDVLEHLDQPGSFLDEMYILLKPGGHMTVAGPTVERRFHDKSDFPPHHKWWFSRPGLQTLLQQHHFEVIATSIQRDGLLFARNFIGRALVGLGKKEFYGDTSIKAPSMDASNRRVLYAMLSALGTALFTVLRIPYCSAIFVAKKGLPS